MFFAASGSGASPGVVACLLHFDGTGSTFTDATGKTCTAFGTATQSATQSVFGGKALDLSTGAGRVQVADSTDFDFGTGAFLIEWRERRTSNAGFQNSWSRGYNLAGGMFLQSFPSGSGTRALYFVDGSGVAKQILNIGGFALNQWVAMAIQRDTSGVIRVFLDGVQSALVGPTADTALSLGLRAAFCIGADSASSFSHNGFIDEFRVQKGVAPYTGSGYTPAASAFTYP
jgi:hypothetical protein